MRDSYLKIGEFQISLVNNFSFFSVFLLSIHCPQLYQVCIPNHFFCSTKFPFFDVIFSIHLPMSFEFFILLQIYVSDFWHFNLGVAALRFVLSQNYGDFTRYSRFQTLGNTSMSNTATPELSHVALLLIWQNFPPISPPFPTQTLRALVEATIIRLNIKE